MDVRQDFPRRLWPSQEATFSYDDVFECKFQQSHSIMHAINGEDFRVVTQRWIDGVKRGSNKVGRFNIANSDYADVRFNKSFAGVMNALPLC